MTYTITHGHALPVLKTIPDASVRCVVTSPPYFQLRDYDAEDQIGREATPDAYIAALVEVFQEVSRILTSDGTIWINLADSYCDRLFRTSAFKLKHKDLIAIPWMTALALRDAGWYLRSDNIWHKPNPMPYSGTDRTTPNHEYLFMFSKSARYYFNADAIAEPLVALKRYQDAVRRQESFDPTRHKHAPGVQAPMQLLSRAAANVVKKGTKNKRSVWTIPTQPYKGAHTATFPELLVEPCILAGSEPGDTILDPFCGTGTTGVVAIHHGRYFYGIDVNPDTIAQAHTRIQHGPQRLHSTPFTHEHTLF